MSETEKSMEERIRERAYALWDRDGQPDGHSEEYWDRAKAEIEAESEAEKQTRRDR